MLAELEQLRDLAALLGLHLLEDRVRPDRRQIAQKIGGGVGVHLFDDVGGTGLHGMLFYSDAPDRRPSRLWGMEPTAYPDQSNPLISQTYMIAVTGDVQIWRADSIILVIIYKS